MNTFAIAVHLFSSLFLIEGSVNLTLRDEEFMALSYMKLLDERTYNRSKRVNLATWAYESNLTEYNLKQQIAVVTQVAKETKKDWFEINKFRWKSFRNPDLRRQFKLYLLLEASALPSKKYEQFTKIVGDMQKIYATVKICDYYNSSKCDLGIEPEIVTIMANSQDPDELKHIWLEWRNAVGPRVKGMYERYVNLSNEAARLNNFADMGKVWLENFESDDIREQLEKLWQQVKPLYLQIHAYVRYKLREKYGDIVSERGPLPAHLLGNIWGQAWNKVGEFSLPYPHAADIIITDEMVKQGYTPLKMFQIANNFFTSLNLTAMPSSFWTKSIMEKPEDGRKLICHPSAWNFFDDDVRIKMCTRVNEKNLFIIHHEIGHLQYYLAYSNQPTVYRKGANSGFNEAVGDAIFLSASSPKHLKKIGLLQQSEVDKYILLNSLYKMGLEKIVFLPFAYLLDLWRWNVFSGKIPKDSWNCKWWELKHKYQGIEPPVDRSENDFDPAAKYHIAADAPYIGYFVSFIIQFQFYRALCLKAGDYVPNDPQKPLHNCDIYGSSEAGNALKNMLQMGASKPWPDALEALTGERKMDAGAFLEYFKPLQTWLEKENKKNGVLIGWESTDRVCLKTKRKPVVAYEEK